MRAIDPTVPTAPAREVERRVVSLLAAGWDVASLERGLNAAAAEARDKKTLRWFNGVDNWADGALRRALTRGHKLRTVPPVPDAAPAPPPAVGSAEERRALMREVMEAVGDKVRSVP